MWLKVSKKESQRGGVQGWCGYVNLVSVENQVVKIRMQADKLWASLMMFPSFSTSNYASAS